MHIYIYIYIYIYTHIYTIYKLVFILPEKACLEINEQTSYVSQEKMEKWFLIFFPVWINRHHPTVCLVSIKCKEEFKSHVMDFPDEEKKLLKSLLSHFFVVPQKKCKNKNFI